jgi:hypothetical protein
MMLFVTGVRLNDACANAQTPAGYIVPIVFIIIFSIVTAVLAFLLVMYSSVSAMRDLSVARL